MARLDPEVKRRALKNRGRDRTALRTQEKEPVTSYQCLKLAAAKPTTVQSPLDKSVDGIERTTYTRDFLLSLQKAELSHVELEVLDDAIWKQICPAWRPPPFSNNSKDRERVAPTEDILLTNSQPTQLPPMPYSKMYIPGTPITFPGGQITTSVPGFHQQYYVRSPHTPSVAGQYWVPSATATQSHPAQTQPSSRPALNTSISAAVPPNMTMSSSFNGTMQQSQMQSTPESNPYSQSLAQNSTRMPTQPLMANVQMVQPTQAAQTYTKPEGRRKCVIAVVDPNTKLIVNKDAMATSIGTTTMGTSPASSSSSTPWLPESDKGVRVEYSHSIKTEETRASQISGKPDITAQFKAQVAQVASLSSSSVSVVSANTLPVLSSNIPSGSAEQTARHPDKEASLKTAAAPSTPVLIKSKHFDARQFVNSVAASVDFTDIASETSHKIYDREKKFLSIFTDEQESKDTCHQPESAVTGSSVTSYLPGAAGNVSDCRDSHLNLASEYNGREDHVEGAYANLGGAHTASPPITESKSAIDEYFDNTDFKVDTKRASNSTHHLKFNMRRLLSLSHVKIGDECDTALHYSAYLNQPDIMKLLLERGSNVNAVNEGGYSTLHVAVNNQHLNCVKVLIEHDCDVNIQDTYGDTPLHDAIGKESTEIVRLLMDHADVDFSLKNKRGFNALHHAALKGNLFAVEKTLFRAPKMVDVPKDDGFSSLHIASLNGHCSVVQALLKQGHADINLKNRRQQTPLMLACTQANQTIVKILVKSGASVMIEDEEGHTALHHVLLRLHIDGVALFNSSVADQAAVSDMLQEATQESAAIAKFLAENNADALRVNFEGQTPLDLVSDYGIKTELKKYITFLPCIVCEEEDASVIFLPCKDRCACYDCCKKMKTCVKCRTPIKKKLLNGAELTRDSPPYQAVKELNIVLQEMEGIQLCEICMDRKRNIVFIPCGHTACDECAQSLKICHNCRKPIKLRNPVFI
ncbi:uncharacterized protein [Watersipora subatra]|uniref:uncharacterized protein isoform X2 n=1 Tax=Watersipora subatra TaxID=2589382 RepID=UPI00355C1352